MQEPLKMSQAMRVLCWVPCIVGCAFALVSFCHDCGIMNSRQAQAQAQGAPNIPKVITAQSFRLVDKNGKERATLAVRGDGTPGLTLYDKDGKLRAAFRLRPDGSSALSMHDGDGKNRAALDTQSDGSASLSLTDKSGKGGVGIVLLPNRDPAILVNDKDGKIIWAAPEPPGVP